MPFHSNNNNGMRNGKKNGNGSTKRSRTSRIGKCEKNIKKMNKKLEALTSQHTFRASDYVQLQSNANFMSNVAFEMGTDLDLTISLLNASTYDPATGAIVTTNLNLAGSNKELLCLGWHNEITLRANYLVPVEYVIYSCITKIDNSIGPLSLFTDGAATISNSTISSDMIFPSDIPELNLAFDVKRVKHGTLASGQELSVSHFQNKPFRYSPSLADEIDPEFVKAFGTQVFIVRIKGVPAHDSIDVLVTGYNKAGVDIVQKTTIKWEYDGGADFHTIRILEGADVFTGVAKSGTFREKLIQDLSRT